MTDREIVDRYWRRDEGAIAATAEKYGGYCLTVANNILNHSLDAEECVNDTWLRTWQALPPQKPERLRPFLAKITRNLAFDRFRSGKAAKRGGGELPLVLEELGECCGGGGVEEELQAAELQAFVNRFLRALPGRERSVFLRRYFFAEPLAAIAARYGLKESHARVILHRTRAKLRAYLEQEGFLE